MANAVIGRFEVMRTMKAARACALLLLLLLGAPALAIVQSTGDGMNTITPPADDPGFDHVGVTGNGLSGIYLGNGWMLTANHVGEQSLTLGGVTYPAVPGSAVQLQYSPGVFSDVLLVRLAPEPPLPPLVLSSAAPAVDDNVMMIGFGWDRSGLICWNAAYAEVTCNPLAAHRGFKAAGAYRIRWGRNLVKMSNMDVAMAPWNTRGFEVQFDQSGVTYEAQGVPGDSGGAVFLKRGSQWELVGVMFAITVHDGQPYYTTAMFGQSTFLVDVAWYRAQIEAITAAPQVPALPGPLFALAAVALAAAARVALRARSR
jgi:hypothetical protein